MEQMEPNLSNVLSTLHEASLNSIDLHRVSDEVLILKELEQLRDVGPDSYTAPVDRHSVIELRRAMKIRDPWPIINSICKESNMILEAACTFGFSDSYLMYDDTAEDALKATRVFKGYTPYEVAFVVLTAAAFCAQTEFEVKLAVHQTKPRISPLPKRITWTLQGCSPQNAAAVREHYRSLLKLEMGAGIRFYPDEWQEVSSKDT